MELEPTLEREIKEGQKDDENINNIRQLILEGRGKDFREDEEGVIWFKDRLCVPDLKPIRELSAFRDRGVPKPTSECAACPSPDGSSAWASAKGGEARWPESSVREV